MPGRDVHEIDRGAEPAGLAEHHIAVAGIVARARRRAGTVGTGAPMMRSSKPSPLMSPAEETEKPERSPASAPWITKPPMPSGDVHEIDRRAESARLAEHHIAVAGTVARARRRAGTVGKVGPDDEVVEAVAVDVAGGGDRKAGPIARIRAVDHEAADAGGDVHEIDRGAKAAGLAEHHIAVAGMCACPAPRRDRRRGRPR